MQVLIALVNARGEILSRDDLIDACWGGRAITDDAINRVVSKLRSVGRKLGSFEIETITKVGYRLVEQPGGAAATLPPYPKAGPGSSLSRRTMIAGGAAATALGTGVVLWRQPWRHRPPAEAVDLFNRGEIAQRQGFAGQTRQAVSFYEQALRIDPDYAEAWGALALSYTHLLEGYGEGETQAFPARLRSAARRALELDPNNADAQLALILLKPSFRNWAALETELLGFIDRHPAHWLAGGRLANLMFDVGRIAVGAARMKTVVERDSMLPVAQAYLANALLNTDRLQEAESILDQAQSRWPAHPSLWRVRYKSLLFNGRPQAAEAFVMNPDARPSGTTEGDIATLSRLARTVASASPIEAATAVSDLTQRAAADFSELPFASEAFALLGRTDLALAGLKRYFFNEEPFGQPAPIDPYSRRYARELFSRPLAPLRSDQRFASILERIGLEAYWHNSGTQPDYRRA